MARLPALIVSLLLVGSGCAGDDHAAAKAEAPTTPAPTSAPPTPSETPSPTPAQLRDEQARRLFDDALRKLVDGDTGRIRMNARLGSGSVITESRFRLSNKSLEARVNFGDGGEELVQ